MRRVRTAGASARCARSPWPGLWLVDGERLFGRWAGSVEQGPYRIAVRRTGWGAGVAAVDAVHVTTACFRVG